MAKKKSAASGDDVLLNINVTGREDLKGAREDAKGLNTELNKGAKAELSKPVASLKQQLREATQETQRLFAAGKQNTEEYNNAARRVAGIRDNIEELNRTFDAFNPDNKFRVFAQAATVGAKAVQGYSGAMAFLGVSSESAQETIAKLQGIMAFTDALGSIEDLKDTYKDVIRVLGLTRAATTTLAAEQQIAALATTEQAIAAEGLVVAEEAATVGAFTLGAALKAIGIGLIISAVLLLITYFSEIKAAVLRFVPALKMVADFFVKITQAVTDFVGITSEAERALDRLVKTTERNNESIDATIKLLEAKGGKEEEIYKLSEKRINNELNLMRNTLAVKGKLTEEELKTFRGLKDQLLVLDAKEAKRKQDEAKEASDKKKKDDDAALDKYKEQLAKYKEADKAAKKVITDAGKSARERELNDIQLKYQIEIDLAKKLGTSIVNLQKAKGIEKAAVAKKYDDIIALYSQSVADQYLNDFEIRAKDINQKADELLKNTTPTQAAEVERVRGLLLGRNNAESLASGSQKAADTDLVYAEIDNRPSASDTPERATEKINNLSNAKLAAENAAFALKKIQLSGQQAELEKLAADHEKNVTDIERENAEARKSIAKIEAENKLKLYDAVANGASVASDLIGESTIAGKALAVASASIATYSAIASQLAAFAGVPVPGYAIAQAIATGLVGLANVKKILTVKVPGKGGGGGGGGATAPVINSTVLAQQNNGSKNVADAVKNSNANSKPLRAFIVNKDLDDQKEKADYYNTQSTY